MRGEFQIRRAGAADARQIASIHVAATRSAYRGIYSDAYLAVLTVAERVCAWTAAGKGHLAAGACETAVFVAVAQAGGRIVSFADVGPAAPRFPRQAELHAIYLDPAQAIETGGTVERVITYRWSTLWIWRISLSANRWPPSDQVRGHASPGYALARTT
jgi:hypothetical protein